ncbi:MAG: Cu(I)/Ag(I) efflux system membrane fusion protein [Myxococcota bacterium]
MKAALAVAAGLTVGILGAVLIPAEWLVASKIADGGPTGEVWACPMLCIKMDRPGTCPVCGMDLERLEDTGDKVILDKSQQEKLGLQTTRVVKRRMEKEIRTWGAIDYNERHVRRISAWVGGRIERLYADHTWADVRQNDHVLQLYSPEIYAAQQEYRAGGSTQRDARRKLELLGMSELQINKLDTDEQASDRVDILSPITGKVIALQVKQGDYVKEGTPLYTVADFSSFWLRFDAYEADLPWLMVGQPVDITLDAAPGRGFPGTISFIEGAVDIKTHTTKVRVTVDNPDGTLRPGMFANVTVRVQVGANARAVPPSLAKRYSCYMHPSVSADAPGECPICGMPLELRPGSAAPLHDQEVLCLPNSAVLSTGARHVVYLRTSPGAFEMRAVQVGVRTDEHTQILSGLEEGDVVATHGNFLIDSQMQLTGKPSLLNPGGGTQAAGHAH